MLIEVQVTTHEEMSVVLSMDLLSSHTVVISD